MWVGVVWLAFESAPSGAQTTLDDVKRSKFKNSAATPLYLHILFNNGLSFRMSYLNFNANI